MKKWLHGWAVTLRIIFSRELYRTDDCCPLFEDDPYE